MPAGLDGGRGPAPADPAAPRWRRWVGVPVALLLAAAAGFYLSRHPEVLVRLRQGDLRLLAVAAAAELALMVLRAAVLRRLSTVFAVRLGLGEATVLFAWSTFANYLLPGVGGSGLRAVWLRRRHGLSLTAFTGVFAATNLLHYSVLAVLGAVAALLAAVGGAPAGAALLLAAVYGAVAAAGVLVLVGRLPGAVERRLSRRRSLRDLTAAWHRLRSHHLPPLLLLVLGYGAATSVALAAVVAMFGPVLAPPAAVLVAMAGELAGLVAVTPAAFGVSEAAILVTGDAVGVTAAVALAAALAKRVAALAVAAVVGAAGLVLLPGRPGSRGPSEVPPP